MKRVAAFALVIAVAGGGVACLRSGGPGVTLRLAYRYDPVTLDPFGHDDFLTRAVLGGIYEPLVRIGHTLDVAPCLAERWDTPDDLTWRIRVRSGVLFHDGTPLEPADVIRSLHRAMDPARSRVATYLTGIESVGVAADDPWTVEIRTNAPQPLLLTRLSLVAIVPPCVLQDSTIPVGTGPYRWAGGSLGGPLRMERWDRYWGDRPAADHVEIVFEEKRLAELVEAGAVDAVAEVSGNLIPLDRLGPEWRVVQTPAAVTIMLGCTVTNPPLDDGRVREAIDLAIDREQLVREAGLAAAEPAACLVPQSVVGALPPESPRAADPARARTLLRMAGWPHGIDLTLEHSGLPRGAVSCLRRLLAEAGIRVTPVERAWDELYRRTLEHRCQLVVFGWAYPFGDASDLLDSLVHSPDPGKRLGLQNGSGYSDPEVDRLIEAADHEIHNAMRQVLIHRVLRKLRADRPLIPLYHRSRIALARRPYDVRPWSTGWVSPQCVVISGEGRPRR